MATITTSSTAYAKYLAAAKAQTDTRNYIISGVAVAVAVVLGVFIGRR